MLRESDLWPGCEPFFDAIAEALVEYDPDCLSTGIQHVLGIDPHTPLGRRLAKQMDSIQDRKHIQAFSRLRDALLYSFQKLASAQKEEDPQGFPK